ncbi:hypothetical protein Tco_0146687, partial [Tanacetum coccineum]
KKEESKAMVTVDGESVDWTTHSGDDDNYAFMASNSSGSVTQDNPHRSLKNKGIIDSGCSRHMIGNKAYLADFQDFNGGPVAFGGSRGYITGKGKIKTGKLDFEDLPDENQVLLKIPRQNNMYNFNLENIVPSRGLACLIAKATTDESNKWHRRLGHVNLIYWILYNANGAFIINVDLCVHEVEPIV